MTGVAEGITSNFLEEVPDLFIVHDLNGKISYVSSFVIKLLDYTPQEFLQNNLRDYVSPRSFTNYPRYQQKIAEEDYVQEVLCLMTKNKQERYFEFNVAVCRQNNETPQIKGVARDITERKWAEKALVDVLGRFESIVEYSPLVAIQSFDANGCIYHWNPVSERLYGMSRLDVLEKPFHELFLKGEETGRFKKDLKRVFEECLPSEARECEIKTANGETRWVYFSMFPVLEEGRCLEAIRMEMDITERKKVEDELEFLSIHDALTGLYNRGYFEEEMRRLDNPRFCPVSIIVCDVDRLKPVNDFWGHTEGDILLQAAAQAIKRPFRSSDVVARIGGDEFVVILPNTPRDTALQVCKRIMDSVKQYNEACPKVPLSISLGVSTSDSMQNSLIDTFRKADHAMYCDKIEKAKGFQDSIPRSLLSAFPSFFAGGLPLYFNDRAREMALNLGEKAGLQPAEISFLYIPSHHFLSRYIPGDADPSGLGDANDPGGHPRSNAPPRIYHILSIVNAYNAMIDENFNRRALSHEEAVAELQRCAGTQFDPELVEKFTRLFG